MKKSYKQMLENKQVTEKLLLSCLATCEVVISNNAKCEGIYGYHQPARALSYEAERLEWSAYREKIRKALQQKYEMKKIKDMTKTHTDKVAQRTVKAVVKLIDSGDFVLV